MLRPLNKRVLIKPDTTEDKTTSGIFIPEHANNPLYLTGRVIAIGSRVDHDLKPNDHVAFQKVYDEIKDGEDTHYLVDDVFLLAVYE